MKIFFFKSGLRAGQVSYGRLLLWNACFSSKDISDFSGTTPLLSYVSKYNILESSGYCTDCGTFDFFFGLCVIMVIN